MSIEIDCSTEVKQQNRKMIRDWVRKHYTRKQLSKAKVLCLPGWQCLEIYEIWDKLGVRRKNIYAITNDKKEYDEICKVRGINAYCGDLSQPEALCDMITLSNSAFLGTGIKNNSVKTGKLPIFDIIYFDIYGTTQLAVKVVPYGPMLLKNNGIFGVTSLSAREKGTVGEVIKQFGSRSPGTPGRNSVMLEYIATTFLNHAIRVANGFHEKAVIIPDLVNNRLVASIKGDDVRPFIDVKKNQLFDILKTDYYPTDCFKSKYVTEKGTPMSTVLLKFRRISMLNKYNFDKMICMSESRMSKVRTIHINRNRNKVVFEKKRPNEISHKSFIETRKQHLDNAGCPYTKKQEIIEFLKAFNTKQDMVDISKIYGYSIPQLRAFKAHITMGTYK
jgi:hypothetical protein